MFKITFFSILSATTFFCGLTFIAATSFAEPADQIPSIKVGQPEAQGKDSGKASEGISGGLSDDRLSDGLSEEERPFKNFYPHLSQHAASIGEGRFGFEPYPGANGFNSFLLDNLVYGIDDNLQIGFIPLLYFAPNVYNGTIKLTLYKTPTHQLGVGFTGIMMLRENKNGGVGNSSDIREVTGGYTNPISLSIYFFSILYNYFIPDSNWSLGVNYNVTKLDSNSAIVREALTKINLKPDWALDTSYRASKYFAISFGVGEQRIDLGDLLSQQVPFGYGLTVSYIRENKTFPRISLGGHYVPSINLTKMLFSFDI